LRHPPPPTHTVCKRKFLKKATIALVPVYLINP
jgi:hypothetical protein